MDDETDTTNRSNRAALVDIRFDRRFTARLRRRELCSQSYAWSPPVTATDSVADASAAASDTAFNPDGNSYSFSKGDTVVAVRNTADQDGPAGSIKWTWQTPSLASIRSVPTPVDVQGTIEAVESLGAVVVRPKPNADGWPPRTPAHDNPFQLAVWTKTAELVRQTFDLELVCQLVCQMPRTDTPAAVLELFY
jgi:hypothetical protein